MTEQAALLTVIAQQPSCDIPRLVYADWLDENGDHDRAEFIRVQVAIQGKIPHMWLHGQEVAAQSSRMWKLLDRHRADWSRLPCPKCRGSGGRIVKVAGGYETERAVCLTCGGTGDLFRRRYEPGEFPEPGDEPDKPKLRTVTFARGFPESVSCTLAEVGRMEAHQLGDTVRHVWVPSEWAKAVVKAAPVVKFVVTDAATTEAEAVGLGRMVRAEVYGKAVPT